MQERIRTVPADRLGKAERFPDAPGRYIEYCKSTVPAKSLAGWPYSGNRLRQWGSLSRRSVSVRRIGSGSDCSWDGSRWIQHQ